MVQRMLLIAFLWVGLCLQTQAQNTCQAPTNVSQVTVNTNQATFSWSAVNNVLGYEVSYRQVGANNWTDLTLTSTVVSINNLNPATVYEIRFRTLCDKSIFSAYTRNFLFRTDDAELPPCLTPENLTTTNPTASSVDVSWQAVNNAQSYEVSYRTTGNTQWTGTMSTNSTSATLTGLNTSTRYEIRVKANCGSNNESPFSRPIATTTLAETQQDCDTPTNLNVGETTENSANVSWNAEGEAWFYQVQYRPVGSPVWISSFVTNLEADLSFLGQDTDYEVRVRRHCGFDDVSEFSETVRFRTQASEVVCSAPTNLRIVETRGYFTHLEWDAVTDARLYEIQYRRSNSNLWLPFITNQTQAAVFTFFRSEQYEFRVRTHCSLGNSSAFSNSVIGFNENCDTPINLSSSGATATSVNLSWNAVPGATQYIVRYRTDGDWFWRYQTTNTNSINLSGNLRGGRSYDWSVQAKCSDDEYSKYPSRQTFTLPGGRFASATGDMDAPTITVYPNPSAGMFHVGFTAAAAGEAQLQVTDLTGRVVFSQTVVTEAGWQEVPVALPSAHSGLYVVQLRQGSRLESAKITLN